MKETKGDPYTKGYPHRCDDHYLVSIACENCGHHFEKAVKKGELAPVRHVTCPNCGCDTGQKTW